MNSFVPFIVESAAVNPKTWAVIYRIRVPAAWSGRSYAVPRIRYLISSNPPGAPGPLPDVQGELLAFNTVPAGDWNLGRLSVIPIDNSADGGSRFTLVSTETARLDEQAGLLDAGGVWHHRTFELADLHDAFYMLRQHEAPNSTNIPGVARYADLQCKGHLSAAIFPNPALFLLDSPPTTTTEAGGVAEAAAAAIPPKVVGVWDWQPGSAHAIANASHVYAAVDLRDPDLAPRFLGHITDDGGERVVGFLLEHVDDGDVREAGIADLAKCRAALRRLHALCFAYGPSLSRLSFLVRNRAAGGVLLQGFAGVVATTDPADFAGDMERLREVLSMGDTRSV